MKVTKLIIPLLGLTSINNADNQVNSIQIEKEIIINTSYEISARSNYCLNSDILTDKNATENLIQNKFVSLPNTQKNGFGELKPVQFHTPEECMQILQAALASCALLGPFAPACVVAAWAAYATCMSCSC